MQIPRYHLGQEVEELFSRLTHAMPVNILHSPSIANHEAVNQLEFLLPQSVKDALQRIAQCKESESILISGVPVGNIPSGESIEVRLANKCWTSENSMLAIAHIMGCSLVSSPKEQGGRIVHNIAPVRGMENTRSSKGREPFYLHTENPFEVEPPDFLMLLGMEADPEALTLQFRVDSLMQQLPEWIKAEMREPLFRIRSGAGSDEVEEGVFPLISENSSGLLRLRLYQERERIYGITAKAERVLCYIEEAFKHPNVQQNIHAINLQKGECLIFNNGIGENCIVGVMHGRRNQIRNPNRWFQRGFLKLRVRADS